jgi:hypothetical protein
MPTDPVELPEPRDHEHTEVEQPADPRVSVMDWLLDIGQQVARRMVPPAGALGGPLARR